MMKAWCAFLRGVNVKGTTMKMEDLKKVFCDMGHADAKTLLASGNVAFTASDAESADHLKRTIEAALAAAFSYDAHVLLRDAADLSAVCDAASGMNVPEECHLYHLLCDDANAAGELAELWTRTPHADEERFLALPCGLFWIVPKGSTLGSDFGSKVLGQKRWKAALTSRNMNTVEKALKELLAMEARIRREEA